MCGSDGKNSTCIDVCGVVESWLQNSNEVMNLELLDLEWHWFGKDRIGTRGGGLGCLVKRSLNPRVLSSESDNILWVEVGNQEKLVVGVVYMVPQEKSGVNLQTLDCLEIEVQQWAENSKVVVLGDFNARVGELPNVVCDLEAKEVELRHVQRASVDVRVDTFGRRVMATMNAIGLALVNGTHEKADWTSFQPGGNAVVDFIWVPLELLSNAQMKVWKEDRLVLGDHALVSVMLRLVNTRIANAGVRHGTTGDPPRKRWNSIRDGVGLRELQVACCQKMRGWFPGLALAGDSGVPDRVELIWKDWCSRVVASAEEGLGYRVSKKPRPKGWDRELANILQERNVARRARDRCSGEDRKVAHGVYQGLQKRVKQRIREFRELDFKKRNALLTKDKVSNPRRYWALLKKAAGLGKVTSSIPDEALVEGLVVKGDLVLRVWQEAFRKLFAADEKDPAFDRGFMHRVRDEISREEAKGEQLDYICEQLNAPITLQEVTRVIHQLKSGKAGGIDTLISEIFKYGGMRLRLQRGDFVRKSLVWREFPGTGRVASSFLCIKRAMLESPTTTAGSRY